MASFYPRDAVNANKRLFSPSRSLDTYAPQDNRQRTGHDLERNKRERRNTTWSYNEKLASCIVGASIEHKHTHTTSWCNVVSSIDPKIEIGVGGHYTDIGHYLGGQTGRSTDERRCFWAVYGKVREYRSSSPPQRELRESWGQCEESNAVCFSSSRSFAEQPVSQSVGT